MDKKTRSKVVSAFINYPEIVLYNLYDGAVDCITGRSIPRGTRIVTTTYATRKKYGIVDENVTMTVGTFRNVTKNKCNQTRAGQKIWSRTPVEHVGQTFYRRSHNHAYDVDFADVDKIIDERGC